MISQQTLIIAGACLGVIVLIGLFLVPIYLILINSKLKKIFKFFKETNKESFQKIIKEQVKGGKNGKGNMGDKEQASAV